MRRFAQALLDHQSEMAAIVVKETGTPVIISVNLGIRMMQLIMSRPS